jgi:hypothetical protein
VNPFVPCIDDVKKALVEDYMWSIGKCNVKSIHANIPVLANIGSEASVWLSSDQFKGVAVTYEKRNSGTIREKQLKLVFLITAYRDIQFIKRLFGHLYSKSHMYIIAVDAAYPDFALSVKKLTQEYGENVFVTCEAPIVYVSSSQSRILSHTMAWLMRYTPFSHRWDYLITCTGSDYPLIGLRHMEAILATRHPPMPSLMSWRQEVWKHGERLAKQTVFTKSIMREVVSRERKGFSQIRGKRQFGLPLTCGNQKSRIRLNPRLSQVFPEGNKQSSMFHTQVLIMLLYVILVHTSNIHLAACVCGYVYYVYVFSGYLEKLHTTILIAILHTKM